MISEERFIWRFRGNIQWRTSSTFDQEAKPEIPSRSSCIKTEDHMKRQNITHNLRFSKLRCYRRLPNSFFKEHVTKKEVRGRIQEELGVNDGLLSIARMQELKWHRHISRRKKHPAENTTCTSNRIKTEKKRRVCYNINEWTALKFGDGLGLLHHPCHNICSIQSFYPYKQAKEQWLSKFLNYKGTQTCILILTCKPGDSWDHKSPLTYWILFCNPVKQLWSF